MGKNTVTAMQSGVYWGYIGMIEGIISRLRQEQGSTLKTVATGGLASLFTKATNAIEQHMPDLTIEGLRLIHDMNTHKLDK
jgi:type III pantothenate kinase